MFVGCASSCSSGVDQFIGVLPGGRRVHSGSLGSLRYALRSSGSSRFAWFIGVRTWDVQVNPGSLVS